MSTNQRMGVYLDMMVNKGKEQIAKLYAEKAEIERRRDIVDSEILKTKGSVAAYSDAMDKLAKIHEDMAREAQLSE